MTFHLKMWMIVNDVTEEFLVENVDLSDDLSSLSFYSEQHANDFLTWFEAYLERFASIEDATLSKYPSLKEGHQEGFFCIVNYEDNNNRIHNPKDDEIPIFKRFTTLSYKPDQDWEWIVRNTQGAVWTGAGWLFKDKIDYCAFKLMQQDC